MQEVKEGLLPYNALQIKNKILVTNRFGSWTFLNKEEFGLLKRHKETKELQTKLKDAGILATKDNLNEILKNYRSINHNLFTGPSLHIVCTTSRCNFNCCYCHASSPNTKGKDMTKETAIKVLENIFKSPSKAITIEFQGGECLLNWDIVKFIITNAKKLNELEKKDLHITAVTNLSLMDDEKLNYLLDNDVSISTSLDGPANVHNKNRPMIGGQPTYEKVIEWIKKIQEESKKREKKHMVGALPTITKYSLDYPKEIVDEYVSLGINDIHLRPLNYLGIAKENWNEIGYSAEEFIEFWKKATDYILELNQNNNNSLIKERMIKMMLTKILDKKDALFTELMSPCGAGRTQITYEYDGSVYTCDEGRMLGEGLFKLGHVDTDKFTDFMGNDTLLSVINASLLDNYNCKTCAYLPWCGTCPVLNISEQGNIIPKMSETTRHKIYLAQFTYIFEKIDEEKYLKIFKRWINNS